MVTDPIKFGQQLLETNDLDPVYVILWNTKISPVELRRWLLAYWCFYHVGTASWCTDVRTDIEFWNAMELAAGSKEWPRSSERRHFRGKTAIKSVAYLKQKGINLLFAAFDDPPRGGLDVATVMQWVKQWYGFGNWIAFKVADMIDRLEIAKVDFNDTAMFLFDSPKEGALQYWSLYGKENEKDPYSWAVADLGRRLGKIKAPPRYERPINSQEIETVLCKWKSHMAGHYKLGEDIEHCREGLLRFPDCKMTQRLLKGGKIGGLW